MRSRSSTAASRANRSPTPRATGPISKTPRRSARTWNSRTTRSNGASVQTLRSTRSPRPDTTRSRSSTETPGLAWSSARSQASGTRRRFQIETVSERLVAPLQPVPAEVAGVVDVGQAAPRPDLADDLEQEDDDAQDDRDRDPEERARDEESDPDHTLDRHRTAASVGGEGRDGDAFQDGVEDRGRRDAAQAAVEVHDQAMGEDGLDERP